MVTRWIKKTEGVWISKSTQAEAFELDEVYWFIKRKAQTETHSNIFVMTMISRTPRQIVGFNVDNSVNSISLQKVVGSAISAQEYYTDGCLVYRDVVFGCKLRQNFRNKKDTHTIESTNADLRHHIPGLARRTRCFYRSGETLRAVISLFVDAYNKFGEVSSDTVKNFHQLNLYPFLSWTICKDINVAFLGPNCRLT